MRLQASPFEMGTVAVQDCLNFYHDSAREITVARAFSYTQSVPPLTSVVPSNMFEPGGIV